MPARLPVGRAALEAVTGLLDAGGIGAAGYWPEATARTPTRWAAKMRAGIGWSARAERVASRRDGLGGGVT